MSLVRMQRKMKTTLMFAVYAFVAVFIFGIFLSFNMGANPSAVGASAEFATINGQPIHGQRFASALEEIRSQFQQFGMGQGMTVQQQAELPRYAYNQLVSEYAQAAAAEEFGVRVSAGDAQAQARQRVEQILEQSGKGLSAAELQRYRALMLGNIDLDQERRQLLSQRLRERLAQEARPVEVKAAHVLIKVEKRTEEAARKLAEDISRQARGGADFNRLVTQHSEDAGSKAKQGVVGWASAQPPAPGEDAGKKPAREPATRFAEEFTAAALRLRAGEVSAPVRSSFGYHVIKALEERDFEPPAEKTPAIKPAPAKPGDKKPAEAKEDPAKKRQEAIDAYRSAAGNMIASGMFSDYRTRLESTVVPKSAWLRGYLLEQEADRAPAAGADGKPAGPSPKLTEAIAAYTEALKKNEPAASFGLAYKLSQLHKRAGEAYETAKLPAKAKAEFQSALTLLEKNTRGNDAEMYFAQGEMQEKLGDKTKALEVYKTSMEKNRADPGILSRLSDRFKALGRKDLAEQASQKQAELQAKQAAAAGPGAVTTIPVTTTPKKGAGGKNAGKPAGKGGGTAGDTPAPDP